MSQQVLETMDVLSDPRVIDPSTAGSHSVISENPTTGQPIAAVRLQSKSDYNKVIERAIAVQKQWRRLPAPKRGEIIRRIGLAIRRNKTQLASIIAAESGKILTEAAGEITECYDIADFASGLSRQLYGLAMHSERPQHRMFEQYHPLGTIAVITAFNFPAAVWAWNAIIAAVCGNAILWKPSLLTPLTAIAINNVCQQVMRDSTDLFNPSPHDPADLFSLVIGTDAEIGHAITADSRLPLVSATGSCRMGRLVATAVAQRLGRTLLELGGNNAIIVMPNADMELVLRGVLFGAVGTAGQRCTTTRRLLLHSTIARQLTERLVKAYASVTIGDPLDSKTLMGPLINEHAVNAMHAAIEQAQQHGCEVLCGGIEGITRFRDMPGHFVEPTIIRVPRGNVPAIMREETFAPILYVLEFDTLDEAIELNNAVSQGLSSAIFTDSVRSAERFLSVDGSDCGIANVNIGTSGAEIGGAFGGEKDTGGGREAGSDSWKFYMRRQTCTINFGDDLPLAQGIRFGD